MMDVVYYWVGGLERGTWNAAEAYPNATEQRRVIRRMGYVAHEGRRSIGAPEGPPSAADFAEVLGQ